MRAAPPRRSPREPHSCHTDPPVSQRRLSPGRPRGEGYVGVRHTPGTYPPCAPGVPDAHTPHRYRKADSCRTPGKGRRVGEDVAFTDLAGGSPSIAPPTSG